MFETRNFSNIILLFIGLSFGQPLLGTKNFSTRFFYDFFKPEYLGIAKGVNVEGMLRKLKLDKVYTIDMSKVAKSKHKFDMPKGAKMAYVKKVSNDLTIVQIPVPKQTRAYECVFNTEYYSGNNLFGGVDFIKALKTVATRESKTIDIKGHGEGTMNRQAILSLMQNQTKAEGKSLKEGRKKVEELSGWSPKKVFKGREVQLLKSGVLRTLIALETSSKKRIINEVLNKLEPNPIKVLKETRHPQIIVFSFVKPTPHCLFGRLELVGNQKVFFLFDSIYGNANSLTDNRIKRFKLLVDAFTIKL
jgi:hypothetical protein